MREPQFKKAFLKAAAVAYPRGPRDPVHMRDILRNYCMGWFDALMDVSLSVDVNSRLPALVRLKELEASLAVIHSADWFPDRSWMWWKKQV